jgi:hypothetical protein
MGALASVCGGRVAPNPGQPAPTQAGDLYVIFSCGPAYPSRKIFDNMPLAAFKLQATSVPDFNKQRGAAARQRAGD